MSADHAHESHNSATNNRQDHVPLCMAKKWLPVTHRHGCAIYWHQNMSGEQQDVVGGELMVSAIIRGTPTQCLAALTGSRQGNSILGPATAVVVLQQSADGSQVLCIHLAPPAPNAAASAFPSSNATSSSSSSNSSSRRKLRARVPSVLSRLCSRFLGTRVAVVQQTLWQDPRGIHCLTFKSVPQEALSSLQQQQQQQQHGQQQEQQQGQQQVGSAHQLASHLPLFPTDSDPHNSSSCGCFEQQAAQHAAHDTLAASNVAGYTRSSVKQQQHLQQQQQAGFQCLQSQQQRLRHRGSTSAPGKRSGGNKTGQQVGQQLQLHACCHSNTTGGSSSSSNCTHVIQQQQHQPYQSRPSWQQQQQVQQQQHHRGLLQPLYTFMRHIWQCLVFLASLLGLQCFLTSSSTNSNSSSSRGGLFGPVHVSVVGGFTVAGLDSGGLNDGSFTAPAAAADGGGDTGLVHETLVTSILKVDLGGCLADGCCTPLHSAAVMLGIVDELRGQMLSAVERVKAEVENPAAAAQRGASDHSPSLLQGLLAQLASIGSMALAPLTTWQTQRTQQPQQRSQRQPQSQQQQQQQQQQQREQRKQARDSSGGQQQDPAASHAVHSRAAASSSGGADQAIASSSESVPHAAGHVGADEQQQQQHLVGRDAQGKPYSGICNPAFWSPLHQPGYPSVFKVRGPSYLADHVKVSAGSSAFTLLAVDLVSTPTAVQHLARFLPSVRRSRAASAFVVNMMVPAADDVMNLVMTWGSSRPWPTNSSSSSSHGGSSGGGGGHCDVKGSSNLGSSNGGSRASSGSGGGSGSATAGVTAAGGGSSGSSSGIDGSSKGFENALRRFLLAGDQERSNMFKMIPHIEVGPWVLQGMVGSTPVIMGRKLATTYHLTERYVEVDIDVTTCRTAGFIVQSIRGATTSLVVDLCYLLESQRPEELPEVLIGAVRFSNIDMSATTPVDTTVEIPCWPQPWEREAGQKL